ncbi:uncharacterized protein GGS22DRAFT_165415 [Annulohypoxylon maeteangense]|uniref:uncharacterized protein n=1 Tax=Annulohypoxylon maeteangense TaxID=1927788 RepID=UPI00200824AF|nr:uncharacterized protein GGS22DRAFT_165415 [Annulohypoxylon maeteangense]KAI0884333.1 hypothetical protein GGS22DRAFT_165415 [Annulohypoxylon maeteangense]
MDLPLHDLHQFQDFNIFDEALHDEFDRQHLYNSTISLGEQGGVSTVNTATTLLSEQTPSGIHGTIPFDGDHGFAQTILELDDTLTNGTRRFDPPDVSFDDFFRNNGAWRPPQPCTYCRRLRLQCFILQTTSANPNPVTSCSSCVALFRQCSLAERRKRQPAEFETPEPVINNLHGVNEELEMNPSTSRDNVTEQQPTKAVQISRKRTYSRSVRKTHLLRTWYSCHLDHPYPSEEEKESLAQRSGLSRTQVGDWFSNARRRQRMSTRTVDKMIFPQGSPMPSPPMSSMTPFERWRRSPPDEEPVSESVIQEALGMPIEGLGALEGFDATQIDAGPSSSSGGSAFDLHAPWHYPSSDSASSYHTNSSADELSLFSASTHSIGMLNRRASAASSPPTPGKGRIFQCTLCPRSFTKKYDWRRHERAVHLLTSDAPRWVCGVPLSTGQSSHIWRLNQQEPECVFCGQVSPTEEHFRSHEFEACAEREGSDRTFARKDHLWQHLFKFHGCRKWEGWKPDLNLLRRD